MDGIPPKSSQQFPPPPTGSVTPFDLAQINADMTRYRTNRIPPPPMAPSNVPPLCDNLHDLNRGALMSPATPVSSLPYPLTGSANFLRPSVSSGFFPPGTVGVRSRGLISSSRMTVPRPVVVDPPRPKYVPTRTPRSDSSRDSLSGGFGKLIAQVTLDKQTGRTIYAHDGIKTVNTPPAPDEAGSVLGMGTVLAQQQQVETGSGSGSGSVSDSGSGSTGTGTFPSGSGKHGLKKVGGRGHVDVLMESEGTPEDLDDPSFMPSSSLSLSRDRDRDRDALDEEEESEESDDDDNHDHDGDGDGDAEEELDSLSEKSEGSESEDENEDDERRRGGRRRRMRTRTRTRTRTRARSTRSTTRTGVRRKRKRKKKLVKEGSSGSPSASSSSSIARPRPRTRSMAKKIDRIVRGEDPDSDSGDGEGVDLDEEESSTRKAPPMPPHLVAKKGPYLPAGAGSTSGKRRMSPPKRRPRSRPSSASSSRVSSSVSASASVSASSSAVRRPPAKPSTRQSRGRSRQSPPPSSSSDDDSLFELPSEPPQADFMIKPARRPASCFLPDIPCKAYSHPYKYDITVEVPLRFAEVYSVRFRLKVEKTNEYVDVNHKKKQAIRIEKKSLTRNPDDTREIHQFRVVFQVCSFHYQRSCFILEMFLVPTRWLEVVENSDDNDPDARSPFFLETKSRHLPQRRSTRRHSPPNFHQRREISRRLRSLPPLYSSSPFEMFARKNKKSDKEWPDEDEARALLEKHEARLQRRERKRREAQRRQQKKRADARAFSEASASASKPRRNRVRPAPIKVESDQQSMSTQHRDWARSLFLRKAASASASSASSERAKTTRSPPHTRSRRRPTVKDGASPNGDDGEYRPPDSDQSDSEEVSGSAEEEADEDDAEEVEEASKRRGRGRRRTRQTKPKPRSRRAKVESPSEEEGKDDEEPEEIVVGRKRRRKKKASLSAPIPRKRRRLMGVIDDETSSAAPSVAPSFQLAEAPEWQRPTPPVASYPPPPAPQGFSQQQQQQLPSRPDAGYPQPQPRLHSGQPSMRRQHPPGATRAYYPQPGSQYAPQARDYAADQARELRAPQAPRGPRPSQGSRPPQGSRIYPPARSRPSQPMSQPRRRPQGHPQGRRPQPRGHPSMPQYGNIQGPMPPSGAWFQPPPLPPQGQPPPQPRDGRQIPDQFRRRRM